MQAENKTTEPTSVHPIVMQSSMFHCDGKPFERWCEKCQANEANGKHDYMNRKYLGEPGEL